MDIIATPADPERGRTADDGSDEGDGFEVAEQSYARHTLAALTSSGALALAGLAVAISGFFIRTGPLAQITYYITDNPSAFRAAKQLAYFGIGTALLALALAMWSLFRPEPAARWSREVAGAAAVLAVVLIVVHLVSLALAAHTKILPQRIGG